MTNEQQLKVSKLDEKRAKLVVKLQKARDPRVQARIGVHINAVDNELDAVFRMIERQGSI